MNEEGETNQVQASLGRLRSGEVTGVATVLVLKKKPRVVMMMGMNIFADCKVGSAKDIS
jgi:hypothetical protein